MDPFLRVMMPDSTSDSSEHDDDDDSERLHYPLALRQAQFIFGPDGGDTTHVHSTPPIPPCRPPTAIERRSSWATQNDIDPNMSGVREDIARRRALRDEACVGLGDTVEDSCHSHGLWPFVARLLTIFIPDFVLGLLCGETMKGDCCARQAWRERLTLCLLQCFACLVIVYIGYHTGVTFCMPTKQISYDHPSLKYAIIVHGRAYQGSSNKDDFDLIGHVANSNFATNLSGCPRTVPKSAYCGGRFNRQCRNIRGLQDRYGGIVTFSWDAITFDSGLAVYGGDVLDLDLYFERDDGFLGAEANVVLKKYLGRDLSRAIKSQDELLRHIGCLQSLYKVGEIDIVPLPCAFSLIFIGILFLFTVLSSIGHIILTAYKIIRITRSLRMVKDPIKERVLILLPCHNVMPEEVSTTLESISADDYPESLKTAVIFNDGDERLHRSMLKWLEITDCHIKDAEILPFISWNRNRQQIHYARVLQGYYTSRGRTLPTIYIQKCHKEQLDIHNPNEPIQLILGLMSSLHLKDRISCLEYEIYHAFRNLTGQTIDNCNFLLLVRPSTILSASYMSLLSQAMIAHPEAVATFGTILVSTRSSGWTSWMSKLGAFDAFMGNFKGNCLTKATLLKIGHSVPSIAQPSTIGILHGSDLCLIEDSLYLAIQHTLPQSRIIHVHEAESMISIPDSPSDIIIARAKALRSRLFLLFQLLWSSRRIDTFLTMLAEILGIFLAPVALPLSILLLVGGYNQILYSGIFLLSYIGMTIMIPMLTSLIWRPRLTYMLWMLLHLVSLPIWLFLIPLISVWQAELNQPSRSHSKVVLMLSLMEHESVDG